MAISCVSGNEAEVVAFSGSDGKKTERAVLVIASIRQIDFDYRISECSDLKIRYRKNGDTLSSPVWVAAYSLRRPAAILDLMDRSRVVADTRQ